MFDKKEKICIVGLGYVGLPLACLLSKHFEVIGYDINQNKIDDLKNGIDETGEVENFKEYKDKINFSSTPEVIKKASFIIVAVPTPIYGETNEPDLTFLKDASTTIGENFPVHEYPIIVYESTVYPGATEDECLGPIEVESSKTLGKDFGLGYSPERVNPGDKKNTIDKITKIIAASDDVALERMKKVYGKITDLHVAPSIKVAEAAKVIENVQRSLNIALMNELALIFDKVGISTKDVLEAAGTKWNFHPYKPGLVGGHCIGVDPYYLSYVAKKVGHEPKIINAGQTVNESMVGLVADKFKDRKNVLVMGLTFKENVPDIRNSKAMSLVNILIAKYGAHVIEHDPLVEGHQVWPTEEIFDGVILVSPHDEFKDKKYSLESLKEICTDDPIIFDVKGFYDKEEAEKLGFKYLTL